MYRHEPLISTLRNGTILDAVNAGLALRQLRDLDGRAIDALSWEVEQGDGAARLLALHAIASARDPRVERLLLDALVDADRGVREHAAWVLADRPPNSRALPGLITLLGGGGFGGMLAQLTLERWGARASPMVTGAVTATLERTADPDLRARCLETMRLLHPDSGILPQSIQQAPRGARSGLRIGQVMLQGRIDGDLQGSGAGDGGGLATLLVNLARALDAHHEVAEVITFTRAFADPAVSDAYETPYERLGLHSSIERLPFGPDGYLPTADHWPFRARIEQELERSLQRHGGLDVVHLRFADAGTFAAARVCRRLGIPVVFTLAPDPHAVLREAEAAGDLSRESFAASDLEHHYLFRARLVDWMLHHADALALLPRAGGERELQALLGTSFHLTRHRRARTIAEGIATRAPGPTGHQVPGRKGAGRPAAVEALAAAIERLPAARHRLPLLVTVGRLHRVKGLPLLVDAWSGDPELFSAFNLVVVGGDLERPTVEEQAVLDEIGAVCGHAAHAHDGLVLLGHRPHGDVPRLLDAAMHGIPGLVAAGGVYACASRKEEFGLALLEALAAGLSAVGPRSGGPPTYIDDGRTGFLADTTSVEGLRSGLRRAAVARLDEARAARSRRLVTERFTVTSMAAELVALYADVTDSSEVEAA